MKNRPKMLSATFVRNVNVPGRYGDGRGGFGLSLLVKAASRGGFSKSWSQSVRLEGRPTSIGLGSYPIVTLATARSKALENARAIAEGHDPRRPDRGIPTFEAASEAVMAIHAGNWKQGSRSEEQWRNSMRDYVFPSLGDKTVNAVSTADVMNVLLPIWTTKRDTARRVRQRISSVMKWAVAQGYRGDNPAADTISEALPKNAVKPRHLLALPYAKVGAALELVKRSGANSGTVLAFELLVLTACRNGEVRDARWSEIDIDNAIWTIPSERMKAGLEHRVPLSDRALAVLDEARRFSDSDERVFQSAIGRPVAASAMSRLLLKLSVGAVPHGFRSSFRDWAAECTDVPREVCELALAHVNTDRVEAAYRRSDLFEKRRKLMDDWATYVEMTSN